MGGGKTHTTSKINKKESTGDITNVNEMLLKMIELGNLHSHSKVSDETAQLSDAFT